MGGQRGLATASTVRFERNEESYKQQATFEEHEHPGACGRGGFVVLNGTEHSNHAKKQEEPAGDRYEHRPVPCPDVVSADDRQARDEHQDAAWSIRVGPRQLHELKCITR
jgi:hypothetical protein